MLRAQHLGWRTLFIPDITAVHVGGDSSGHPVDLSLLLVESQLRFARARYGRRGEWTLRFALLGLDGARYLRGLAGAVGGRPPTVSANAISARLRLYIRGAR